MGYSNLIDVLMGMEIHSAVALEQDLKRINPGGSLALNK